MKILKFISNLIYKLFVFIITIVLLSIILALSPLLCLIYLYRYLLSISAKYFRKDLSKILTSRSQILSCDNLYSSPRSTLIVYLGVDGPIGSTESEIEYLYENLVLLKNEKGELKRPEFQQYMTYWGGFPFWKWDPYFDIKNHIYEYNGPLKSDVYNPDDLHAIGAELLKKPFDKYKSPWEWIIVRNCDADFGTKGTTGIFIKIHHSLGDGFSILKLTTEIISSDGTLEPMQPLKPKHSMCQRILRTIGFAIIAPFELIDLFLRTFDNNVLTIPERKLTNNILGAIHPLISIDYVKKIKNLHDTSFTSVLLEAFTGGVRKFMIENDLKVPKHIHCLIPFPMYNHPNKLRNFATIVYIKLPIGIKDPLERLHSIEKDLNNLKNSTCPLFMFYLMPFIGSLFPWMTNLLSKQYLVTAAVSNFPAPKDLVWYNNSKNKILDIIFLGGMLNGRIGLGLSSISYNGNLRIGAGLDAAIPTKTPVTNLVADVISEFDVLNSLAV